MDKAVIESPLSWLELNRANLLHNLAGVRALVGKTRIMAVVKANAYGAGAVAVARELSAAGIDLFGVANVREGVELREDGIVGTIVGLTYFTRDEIDAILDFDLTPAIFTVDAANALSERARALNRRARVWIKIDTGLGRIGVPFQVARDFIAQIARLDGLE
ncbi:MAG: alanine racemase, partial [Chloroflexota bacterium]